MSNLTRKLQIITKSDSANMADLFHSFEKQFFNETNLITLLRAYIFSEVEDSATEDKICNALDRLINKKG